MLSTVTTAVLLDGSCIGARQTVYAMARNMACQWGKNSWQCGWRCDAWTCIGMRVRWNSPCHVVAIILKCVTTCHNEIVVPLSCHFANSS